jgi:hypothetical protein
MPTAESVTGTTPATAVPAADADAFAPTGEGLPSATGPQPQALLAPDSSAPPTLAVRLESQPAGARVFVDDREVGTTPVEVRIVPTADHVIRFERTDCSDHVRFLTAAGWEKGRSTKIVAQLECP